MGHFENLIEFDDAADGKPETATRTGWRYGPFLTTKFGHPGPLDYKHIVGNETEGERPALVQIFDFRSRPGDRPNATPVADVVYDWHITWSSVTPGRLGALSTFLKGIAATVAMPHNRTEHELASAQQMNEFWRELRRIESSDVISLSERLLIHLLHGPDANADVVAGHDEPQAVRPVTRLVLEFFGDVTLMAQEM